jgi:hypothetical protein
MKTEAMHHEMIKITTTTKAGDEIAAEPATE